MIESWPSKKLAYTIEEVEEAKHELLKYNSWLSNEDLRIINKNLINYPSFARYPASLSKHHPRLGGLIVHTHEVCKYAIAVANITKDIDFDVLVTGAIWHDAGKTQTYTENFLLKDNQKIHSGWGRHQSTKSHGHIALSFEMFLLEVVCGPSLSKKLERDISHLILSHHGSLEYGSPADPQSKEAWILHEADMLSARVGNL